MKILFIIFLIFFSNLANGNTVDQIRDEANKKPFVVETKTATDLANEFLLESGVNEGWNESGKFFVSVGTAYFADDNIAKNSNFINIRSLKSFEANITAKGQIISYIRTKLSAEDIVSLPSTGLTTDFDKKKLDIEKELNIKIQNYQRALINYDNKLKPRFSDLISKITITSIMAEPLQNFISKIDITFDPNKNDNSKALKKAELELLKIQNEIDQLKASAKKLQKQLQQENVSSVETFSSMTLVGAFQVAHFESFINGQYEISTILMWSPKNENRVLSLLKGEDIYVQPGNLSLNDYIKSTNWASAIGGRKFIDNNGEFHLIGIGAAPVIGKSSAAMRTTKGRSELHAQKELAIALKGDLELSRSAKEKLQEIKQSDGSIKNEVASSFSENISQKLKDLQIQGASRKYNKTVKHPLTNQDMFVSVYSLSVSNTKNARAMEASQYKSAVKMNRVNQSSKIQKFKQTKSNTKDQTKPLKTTSKNKSNPSSSSRSKIITVSVDVTGIGTSKKDSIKDGLLQAISQVNGLQMSSESISLMKTFQTANENEETFASQAAFQEKIKQSTKGVIQSWTIVKAPELKEEFYETSLIVKVSKLKLSTDLKRMKFVVSPVVIGKSVKDLSSAKSFSTHYNKSIRSMLVKSNRFGILDRINSTQINKELKNIKGNNVRVEELAKLGNKVGADYLIISSLIDLNKKNNKEKIAGEIIKLSKIKIELDINIIDVATTQIIFSDKISLVYNGGNISGFANIISKRFAKNIVDTFYPAKIISADKKEIIVDQGRSFFSKKSQYNILKLGKKIKDQTTGLLSGRVEKKVGELTFVSGNSNQSSFKIKRLSIKNSSIKPDGSFIVRPVFKKLPTAKEAAKLKIKEIKSKNKKMIKKIDKDKDW